MSKWLKCDCGGGDAYAVKNSIAMTTGTGFSLDIDVCVPAATLSAIFAATGAGSFTADWFNMLVPAASQDGVYGLEGSGVWRFYADRFTGSAAGTVGTDVSFHVNYAATWNGGASHWDIVVTVDGTALLSYSTTAFGATTDTLDTLRVGGWASNSLSGEIYYVDNVVLKNGSGSTVFSDDFESGGTAAWSSTTGTVSVVEFTPSGSGAGLQAARVF